MKTVTKLLAWIFFALLLWAAYVQGNDPDAGLWIGIYLLAALGALLFALGRLPSWVALLLAISGMVGAYLAWPVAFEGVQFTEQGMANSNIEEGREAVGLVIVSLVYFFFSWKARGRHIS